MKLSKYLVLFCAAAFLGFSCSEKQTTTADYGVIPLPKSVEVKSGEPFKMTSSTKIVYPQGNENLKRLAEFLSDYIQVLTNQKLAVTEGGVVDNAIILSDNFPNDNKEAYNLTVTDKQIVINGASSAGTFYGIQTLRKSIDAFSDNKDVLFNQVDITDYPRFEYRGMMLDVARHFSSVEFVKKYIDLLALHNMNSFHWHLTDDQGWRIEIKKYPGLTEIGSKRKETVIGRNTGEFDGIPQGGFYTQEEAKEIVAYAKDRFINVVPEIDLPGHMLGALSAYPQLGCTGGPYEVEGRWGVFDDVLCAGNDSIIVFLKDVFTEILDIFPSKNIHIGGDECPKTQWEKCPKCQAKIKSLGLKTDANHTKEEYLQSYVINEVEKFLNSKGRKIIGWDEILEGGLAPNATVMSWRGTQGGIEAAKQGNDVIMTPTSHLYFDYYQTVNTKDAPLAIGGYVPLEKVYSFDPIPSELTPEQAKHILGVQANLWVEYIKTPEHIEYMVLPRMDALSEVQWVDPSQKEFDSFIPRLFRMLQLYDKLGYNYATHIFDINIDAKPNVDEGTLDITIKQVDETPVYYTIDGTEPTKKSAVYTEPVKVKDSVTFKAVSYRGDKEYRQEVKYDLSKSALKPITLNYEPKGQYAFNGKYALIDGLKGNAKNYKDGSWIGFIGGDLEALFDLQQPTEISSVTVGSYVCTGDWIFGITGLSVFTSEDGKTYNKIASAKFPEEKEYKEYVIDRVVEFSPVKAQYVKVLIEKTNTLPKWHTGAGKPAYLFIDEIAIN